MIQGPAGNVAVRYLFPKILRDETATFDKSTIQKFLTVVAEKYPERYRKIIDNLFQLGRLGATYSTGFSFGVSDLKPHPALNEFRKKAYQIISEHLANGYDMQDEELARKIGELADRLFGKVKQDLDAEKNPAYIIFKSGVRGNETTIKRLKFTEGVYPDSWQRLIPYPVTHSFAQGLPASEYWASAYGSKQGIVTTKLAPGKAGFIYKQLVQAAQDIIVTSLDGPHAGTLRGLPIDTADDDSVGAILAHPAGGFPAGTKITPEVLQALRDKKIDQILIHSPAVGGPPEGIYAIQAGYRGGFLPSPGELVGLEAAQAIGERVSQMAVGKKHQGMVRGGISSATEVIEKLISIPEQFPGASHALVEGKVDKIEPSPAGGYFIYINGQRHYASADTQLLVKPGDYVEAGDVLTTGLPNPYLIVRGKGIGEGRRYFIRIFTDVLRASNFSVHRRNVEVLARGLINFVVVTKPFGEYLPGDFIKYNYLEHDWKPRPGTKQIEPERAIGMYLETPVLHYTIGTKITKRVAETLKRFGIDKIQAHEEPPPFEPIMIRALEIITKDPDWLVRLLGAYQKRSLLEAAAYGGVSEKYKTPSFVPSLAEGMQFGLRWPQEFLEKYKK